MLPIILELAALSIFKGLALLLSYLFNNAFPQQFRKGH